MEKKKEILLAFYGDDFTGSTDALEFICRSGAKTILFIEPPTMEQLAGFPDLDAYGVAGKTRALPQEEMEKILLSSFEKMKATGARHVHYKTCSTFDSSPTIGSIGKAIDCGAKVFKNELIPIMGGMPALGRYCLFGNLFARMGIGSNGEIYRLDRHPSMSKHPVTPADESDLRLHLGKQTNKKIGLIDVLQLDNPTETWKKNLLGNEKLVLIDALHEEHLQKIGEWLDVHGKSKGCLFSVGPSGIEFALGSYWNNTRVLQPVSSWPKPGKAKPLLVLSGSCSPITKNQIEFALSQGFIEVPLEVETFQGNSGDGFFAGGDLSKILSSLKKKKSVIVHTGNIKEIEQSSSARTLGKALGSIARKVCEEIKLKRLVIAGGDTSSYVARAMGIQALEIIAPLVPGAPLCKIHATSKSIDGLEINFKGGQVGSENYFETLMKGGE